MPKSLLDQITDHPVEALALGLLGALAYHKIYKTKKPHDPTLACFLDNISSKKGKPELISDVVKRVEECQGKRMNNNQISTTLRILQGNGGIMRDNFERVWLTDIGANTRRHPDFKKYHSHIIQNKKIAA